LCRAGVEYLLTQLAAGGVVSNAIFPRRLVGQLPPNCHKKLVATLAFEEKKLKAILLKTSPKQL